MVLLHVVRRMGARTSRSLIKKVKWAARSTAGVARWALAGCSIRTMCMNSLRAGPAVASSIPPMRPVASTRLQVMDTSVASTHVFSKPTVFFQYQCSSRSNLDNLAVIGVERPSGVVDWKGRRTLEITFQISARGWNAGIHVPPGVVFNTNPLPAFTVMASRLPSAGFVRKSR
ncbi:hypothetical protein B0H16DRAFT_1543936 [Mycena metata]|uniref:Uncharacterized protein n=1 Tax=Mycena metata TaxID=1033252 RepID=A0AAD7NAM4_9AGAR|nr:hypothetical protein B0H16DRAFT_1543936 [Mycena metata]